MLVFRLSDLEFIYQLEEVKRKQNLKKITRKIDYFDKTFQEVNYRNKGNHRFIYIADFPRVIDIFIGKETGDFSPKFEQ